MRSNINIDNTNTISVNRIKLEMNLKTMTFTNFTALKRHTKIFEQMRANHVHKLKEYHNKFNYFLNVDI